MKITDVYIKRLKGKVTRTNLKAFSDTSIVNATDIYPDFVRHSAAARVLVTPQKSGDKDLVITHDFLYIETDEGITGVVGPVTFPGVSYYLLNHVKHTLMGQDPMRIEYLSDIMYRIGLDQTAGDLTRAMSHAEAALWDIKCKKLGVPLYELLGGKCRDEAPLYLNISCIPHEDEIIGPATKEIADEGFLGVKIYSKYGPAQGREGIEKTVHTLETVRNSMGPDKLIALEAICCWDYEYTMAMAKRIADLDIAWIEEPCLPECMSEYARLRRDGCPVKLSAGEHSTNRYNFRYMMQIGAVDYYQPEPTWDGGIGETMHIIQLASAFNAIVYPHGCVPNIGAHIMTATSPVICPFTEYILNINDAAQYFMKYPAKPVNGKMSAPEVPGIGCEIDWSKVDEVIDVKS